ncbi:MAG: tetratricopeptide repeat protein [Bacteroidetes bacterium]|nr:tetratricopeptide repeat protein [Bacteroidota bacterium]
MRKIFFALLFFSIVVLSAVEASFAQRAKIDSLFTVIKTDKEDTNQVLHLADLSAKLMHVGAYDSAAVYGEKGIALAEKISYDLGLIKALNNSGEAYRNLGNFPKALSFELRALGISEKLGDKNWMAGSYSNIGSVYRAQGNNKKFLEYQQSALKLYEETSNKIGIGWCYNNIGLAYQDLGDLDKALENLFQSAKVFKEAGNKKGLLFNYNNIGAIYEDKKNLSEALKYFLLSMEMNKEFGDKGWMALHSSNIGTIYFKQGKYKEAEEYLKRAEKISKEIFHKEHLRDASGALAQLYDSLHDYKSAYEYHKQFSDVKDSLLNEESAKQIAEMQTKYETEKKEQQITLLNKDKQLQDAQLNRQKIIIWSVAGGLLVVLTLSIFIFRERRKSEKLLLNILPAETAKELKAKGKASPKYYESVTVMFTDFKGFTNIAEKLSAEELVSELDFLFKKFDEIISKYNIEKIKTIGDAYMCASGLPTPNSNHAEEIVKAGIEIQSWMKEQNNKWSLRMGIHSGPVTAGVVGDKKFAYDIWGDTVNTASRMESSGEPGKINISGTTYQILQGFQNLEGLEFKFRGKIPAKNKGEIEMYFVERSEMRSIHEHN